MSNKPSVTFWPYIISAYTALFAFGILDIVRGPYFPDIINELQLLDSQGAWMFATASLVAFFGSYFAPLLLNRVGSMWGLRISMVILALGFYYTAIVQNYFELIVGSAIFGLGLGFSQVFEHTSIHEGASEKIKNRLFNGLHSMYAGAALLAPLVSTLLVTYSWTWREAFKAFSLLPIIAMLVTLPVKTLEGTTKKVQTKTNFKDKDYPHMVYISVILAFYMAGELSISTRLVLYIQRVLNVGAAESYQYLTVFFVCLLASRVSFVVFDFRRFSNQSLITCGLLLSFTMYLAGLNINPWIAALSGFCMGPVFATIMDWMTQLFKEKSPDVMALSLAIGSIFVVSMHYFLGLFSDWYGIANAMYIGPALLLCSLLMAAAHPKLFKAA